MSPEAQLTQAFRTHLGRDPEAGQIAWRLGQLRVTPLAQQLANIASSPEASAYRAAAPARAQSTYEQAIARQRQEQEALLARQKAEQEGYFGQYESTIAGQEKLPSIYQRLRTEQGLPELEQQAGIFKEQIFRTRGLLDRLAEDINARTAGTFTSEAQRRRIEAAEGESLRNQLGRLGTGLEPISERLTAGLGQVSTLLGLESSERERALKPLEMRVSALSDRFAREITGYTQSSQNELTALLDKLENERRLEQREWERVQQLAAEEREFARQKASAASAASNAGAYLRPGAPAGGPSPAGVKYIGKDDFRGRLAYEANRGNSDARIALKYSGNDGRYDGAVSNLGELSALQRTGIRGNYYVPGLSSPSNTGLSGLRF